MPARSIEESVKLSILPAMAIRLYDFLKSNDERCIHNCYNEMCKSQGWSDKNNYKYLNLLSRHNIINIKRLDEIKIKPMHLWLKDPV